MRQAAWKLLAGLLAIVTCLAQSAAPASSNREASLKKILQDYVTVKHFDDDKTAQYAHAFVDLNGDGKDEAIVYMTGQTWCGSGGCSTWILRQQAASRRFVQRITITRVPIRVLDATSNGWHNISVRVAGGGISPPYQAELRFNGRTYPNNPSVPPARPLGKEPAGKAVIPDLAGQTPLFP